MTHTCSFNHSFLVNIHQDNRAKCRILAISICLWEKQHTYSLNIKSLFISSQSFSYCSNKLKSRLVILAKFYWHTMLLERKWTIAISALINNWLIIYMLEKCQPLPITMENWVNNVINTTLLMLCLAIYSILVQFPSMQEYIDPMSFVIFNFFIKCEFLFYAPSAPYWAI